MIADTRNCTLFIALALLLTACGPSPSTQPQAQANETLEPIGRVVELASSSAEQKNTTLAPGNSISGQFLAPENGRIGAFSVLIGNYFNTSDGSMNVELCQRNRCQSGSGALAASKDNSMFQIKLDSGLDVVATEPVTYKVTKSGGKSEVAVWTFSPNDSISAITGPDGNAADTAPKISLLYEN